MKNPRILEPRKSPCLSDKDNNNVVSREGGSPCWGIISEPHSPSADSLPLRTVAVSMLLHSRSVRLLIHPPHPHIYYSFCSVLTELPLPTATLLKQRVAQISEKELRSTNSTSLVLPDPSIFNSFTKSVSHRAGEWVWRECASEEGKLPVSR